MSVCALSECVDVCTHVCAFSWERVGGYFWILIVFRTQVRGSWLSPLFRGPSPTAGNPGGCSMALSPLCGSLPSSGHSFYSHRAARMMLECGSPPSSAQPCCGSILTHSGARSFRGHRVPPWAPPATLPAHPPPLHWLFPVRMAVPCLNCSSPSLSTNASPPQPPPP